MLTMIYLIVTGFLVRADGWGGYPRIDKYFNAITCSLLFALLTAFYASPLVAVVAGFAFWLFRAPGFDGWQNWLNMLWRGFWPTFIGFTVLSLVAHGVPYYGVLSAPFAALYMLIYAGGYKWLPESILGFNRHVWIEHASGWLLGLFILQVA
jgi:hypothetical protein